MKTHTDRHLHHLRQGFTLVELLVVMVVFLVLTFLLVQATTTAQTATSHQLRQMDAITSARMALDNLTEDISTLVTRGGTGVLFKPGDATTNDTLKFVAISRNSSQHPRARMTIVSYTMETRPHPLLKCDLPMLVRGSAPLLWPTDNDIQAEDYLLSECLSTRALGDSDVTGEHAFRFELVWMRRDGTITRDPRGLPPYTADQQPDPNGFIKVDLKEVRAFIASIAVLDGPAQRDIAEAEGFGPLQMKLVTMSTSTALESTPASFWQQAIAELPPPARQHTRVLQRTYYLPQ
ncbi:prepilin-type N-terminal cleavage/methylation domain-containing protein [Verrucomicrobium sp. BvORR034]|uniref:prepilin-type N-terminal cleavage/methylation domain-containing protein n=1 Tax=Verrucomicrobium sp. BvORR034 TaxID=1396418 RepID=UPI000679B09B|nr:prepilin-type N-terminal cleavage/methylation domain-containing protein [Verrucomicrobium sp. BvORR034]